MRDIFLESFPVDFPDDGPIVDAITLQYHMTTMMPLLLREGGIIVVSVVFKVFTRTSSHRLMGSVAI